MQFPAFGGGGGGRNWLTGRSFKALKVLTKNEIFDLAIIIVGS